MRDTEINFTQGNIIRSIFLFALPIIMGEILQNLYNSVDSLVVGNFVGDTALAAVGICSTLSGLLVSFFNGMSVGSTVVVAKAFGKGNDTEIRNSIQYTLSFAVFLGIILSACGILLVPVLLRLSGANEEIFQQAEVYLRIYLAGLMFTVIYNSESGILRAVGDSRTPFYILCLSSAVNIGLDMLFVAVLSLGIVGVGIATVISQFLSVVLIYLKISSKMHIKCVNIKEMWLYGRKTILEAMNIGFSAGIQGALISFSNVFIWRYVNMFSTSAVAGITIAQRIDKFVSLPLKSYGMAMTTFVGHNIGAGCRGRIKTGIYHCLFLSWGTFLLLSLIVYPFAGQLSALFNDSKEVIEVSVNMMRTVLPFYAFFALREILLGVLRGHGKSRISTLLTLTGMVGVRQIFLAVSMRYRVDIRNIYYGYPVAWIAAAILVSGYYLIVRKEFWAEQEKIE